MKVRSKTGEIFEAIQFDGTEEQAVRLCVPDVLWPEYNLEGIFMAQMIVVINKKEFPIKATNWLLQSIAGRRLIIEADKFEKQYLKGLL